MRRPGFVASNGFGGGRGGGDRGSDGSRLKGVELR